MTTVPSPHPAAGHLTVVVVDDDEAFRLGLADSLREDGCAVYEYPTPNEVPPLATLGAVDVVVTDYDMPGSDGLCFADRVHDVHPAMPIVLVTAQTGPQVRVNAARRPFVSVVHKPVDYSCLHHLLQTLAAEATSH